MNDRGDFSVLRNLFGDNRAEWSSVRFRELFTEPAYFKKLQVMRPTILVGGRGTGKTTSLRSLRFDSTLDRLEAEGSMFGDQEYLGVFVRMNKNRVHAFQGQLLEQNVWDKAFSHYFNLLVCEELTKLSIWLENKTDAALSADAVRRIAKDLAINECTNLASLRSEIKKAVSELQLYVNNPSSESPPKLSLSDAPLRTYVEAIEEEELTENRTIFCCIDEYENLLDSQQSLLNTYIKHAEPPLSYKVGVRNNGLRSRETIAGSDLLTTPDDFEYIEIEKEGFELFAENVANRRLERARLEDVPVPARLRDFLAELSFSEEAKLLGAETSARRVREHLSKNDALDAEFRNRPLHELYFIEYWATAEGTSIYEAAVDWLQNPDKWKNRLNNHGYASLFWLSKGRKGARVRKYYCGTKTLLSLAGGNIRYFLELLDRSINEQYSDDPGAISAAEFVISAKSQTYAARYVGEQRLEQLEGRTEHGVNLKRLVLAIGKVLFELARSPIGKTPEVTHFIIGGALEDQQLLAPLIREGIAHLAFEATPRTKATTESEMRDDEYRLHPIFSAFFEISHRRKRRLSLDAAALNMVARQPSKAISTMLGSVEQSVQSDLPEQLAFFTSFFEGIEPSE